MSVGFCAEWLESCHMVIIRHRLEEEMKNALSVPELVMEINSRTLVRLLSGVCKTGRRVLGLLLSGCSPEMTANGAA